MPHPERKRANDVSPVTDAAFEEVRQSFIVRLGAEQEQLAILSQALQGAEEFPVGILEELERFAHRLRGAAAVFALPELRDAAKVLELAASAAVAKHASRNDLRLQRSTRLLAARLIRMDRRSGLTAVAPRAV
jgi:HPt (histidine-containing phosphotransfer) domain-containing protein